MFTTHLNEKWLQFSVQLMYFSNSAALRKWLIMCPTTENLCQDELVCCCIVKVVNVPLWQIPAHLFNLAKNRFPPWHCGYAGTISCHCGLCLIDVVFTTLLLHTTSHPYHLSSTAQQQVWLSSQTIRTVHITTHDRHKLSRAHQLIAYSDVPGALPGCQLASWDIEKGADPADGFIVNFCFATLFSLQDFKLASAR